MMSEEISKTLVKSCESGDLQLVKTSLAQNADVNFSRQPFGWTPLTSALFHKHPEIVNLLLKHPNINVDLANSGGMTPLHMAADLENLEAMSLILQRSQASLNIKTSSGCTPLMVAATYGKLASVKLLLQFDKVDLNTKNFRGKTLEDVSKYVLISFYLILYIFLGTIQKFCHCCVHPDPR